MPWGLKMRSVFGNDFCTIVVAKRILKAIYASMQVCNDIFEVFCCFNERFAMLPHFLCAFLILSYAICDCPLAFLDLITAFIAIIYKLLISHNFFDVLNHLRGFLSKESATRAALVSAWASVSQRRTESSRRANLPSRLGFAAMVEPDTIDEPVLLKIEDCICAYLLRLISSKFINM